MVPAAFVSSAIVLTFDQLAFFPVLQSVSGVPFSALAGGWIAKIGAAAVYSVFIGLYLRFVEPEQARRDAPKLGDVFHALTYRHRYEDLLKRAMTDELTGVGNRSAFEQACRDWLERASPDGRPMSLAIADIDHFKTVNDELGHAAGDEVLRRVAGAFRTHVRAGDRVFRYGGEEFVLMFRDLAHDEAMALANRLRFAVQAEVRADDGRPATVSIGVSTSTYGAGDLRGLLQRADQRLYEAKRQGRNRVVGEMTPA